MYCSKCGNELEEGVAFCNKCGTKVGNVKNTNSSNKQENNNNSQAKIVNTTENNQYIKNEIKAWVKAIIVFALIVVCIIFVINKLSKNSDLDFDKQQMLSTIQKYSYSTVTVDDFSIKQIEKTNTSVIYKVSVKKSNYLITGDFYVGLIKPTGGSSAKYVLLDQNLTKLKNAIENY